MSETKKAQPVLAKESPILPDRQAEERPLFVILAIMSFLTAMTLLIVLLGMRMSAAWQSDLASSLTVQVYSEDTRDAPPVAETALAIVKNNVPGSNPELIDESETRNLLRPWLGDVDLPEDIPVPVIIKANMTGGGELDVLRKSFEDAGLVVDIDAHSRWQQNIRGAWRGVQLFLIGIMVITMLASVFVASYATQSVLRARQNIIDVLSHVGATNGYIARLFVTRFISTGLKAAFAGCCLALVFMVIFLIWYRLGYGPGRMELAIKFVDLLWLGLLALFLGAICGLTAGRVTRQKLRRDARYG